MLILSRRYGEGILVRHGGKEMRIWVERRGGMSGGVRVAVDAPVEFEVIRIDEGGEKQVKRGERVQ